MKLHNTQGWRKTNKLFLHQSSVRSDDLQMNRNYWAIRTSSYVESCVKKYNKAIFRLEDSMKDWFSYGHYYLREGDIDPETTQSSVLQDYGICNHYISKIYQKLPEVWLKNT